MNLNVHIYNICLVNRYKFSKNNESIHLISTNYGLSSLISYLSFDMNI